MKKRFSDQLVVGFALFSMFFGAGNIIFPPYLGMGAGSDWFLGFICYYLADIGLSVLAIFALIKSGGEVEDVTGHIGKIPGTLMFAAMILCIGPLIAIPRTGATTYEMFVTPVFGDIGSKLPIAIFFAVILLLTIRESSVIDIIGKFLTPALFIGLILLIIKGIITPIGPIASEPQLDNVVVEGVNSGYQTMDVLAALAFGIIIVKTVMEKGYTDTQIKYKVVCNSSLIAAAGLLVIYCGLTFLGATASTLYGPDVNRSQLIVDIIHSLMGQFGVVVLGIVVTLACITTAAALVSASADYFSQLSNGRLGYKALTVVICLFSAFVANFGIDQIVAIAQPVLNLIYPGALTLIVLSFFAKRFSNDYVIRGAVIGATLGSLCEILYGWGVPLRFVTHLPLSDFGFGWISFAAIFAVGTALIFARRKTTV
ncbi:branched-chain amino acid transport system II carrier protein [Anaerovorax odorimutans]|uniref:Branched-chain amino acid transport system carrier protein n=1 Tax=Anaerovorax odorimutans TaxID=109327 RepID=A0ABT1RQ78_9FIRM|nr:branched-chain amino acid transport system II carrier protein [Anaerovorax odorimutans]MCQ4637348.1 branched-chain amino acid transport system II carrier protein [Anaerovorax odorimutans]